MSGLTLVVSLVALCGGCHRGTGGGATDGGVPWTCSAAGTATVTVDLSSTSVTTLHHGYVHGIRDPNGPTPTSAEVAALTKSAEALHAKTWRVSDPWHAQFFAPMHLDLTYVLFDRFAGYDKSVQPWVPDFTAWDAYVKKVAKTNLDSGSPISTFDIWAEPVVTQADATEVLDTYHHGYVDIRSVDPNVKVVGPCTMGFDTQVLGAFLDDALARGDTYAGLCWHSFGKPEDVITQAQQARQLIAARPALGNMDLYVNEYMPYDQHLVPGYNVAWLADLEAAHIAVANRACWQGVPDGSGTYDDCWAGIEGVYLRDGVTPQPVYWVLSAYGDLGTDRYKVTTSVPTITALAGRDASTGKLVVLVGYESAPASAGRSVHLVLDGVSASSVAYTTDRVPSVGADLRPVALIAPDAGPTGSASASGGSAQIDLGCIPEGAAVVVHASP